MFDNDSYKNNKWNTEFTSIPSDLSAAMMYCSCANHNNRLTRRKK